MKTNRPLIETNRAGATPSIAAGVSIQHISQCNTTNYDIHNIIRQLGQLLWLDAQMTKGIRRLDVLLAVVTTRRRIARSFHLMLRHVQLRIDRLKQTFFCNAIFIQ